jgi:hypothetical protein
MERDTVKKTVFISSTYEDLAEHRRAVREVLNEFNVVVRGMEQFGARTEAPLDTCLAEVEQSDVYVGIVAFRVGSIENSSDKSFTQLEYEHALQLKKEILIYLADEEHKFRLKDMDDDPKLLEKLKAFKGVLQARHTVDTFSGPEDLAEKIRRNFARYFEPTDAETKQQPNEFDTTLAIVKDFLLMPKLVLGREARFRIAYFGAPYPASRSLCTAFNLEYGLTIGTNVGVEMPMLGRQKIPFNELYATGPRANKLLGLIAEKGPMDIYARVQFAEQDVDRVRGEFFSYAYDSSEDYGPSEPDLTWVSAEGKAILLFSRIAS